MLDKWPLAVSILSRTVGGSAMFCSFGCFVLSMGSRFWLAHLTRTVLGAVFSKHFQWGKPKLNPCGASTAKANSAWMMWFDLAHHSFGSAFSTPISIPVSACVQWLKVCGVSNNGFYGIYMECQTFSTEDLDADEHPEHPTTQWQFEMAQFATIPWASWWTLRGAVLVAISALLKVQSFEPCLQQHFDTGLGDSGCGCNDKLCIWGV